MIRTRFLAEQQLEISVETRPGHVTQHVRLSDAEFIKIMTLWARSRYRVIEINGDSGSKPGRLVEEKVDQKRGRETAPPIVDAPAPPTKKQTRRRSPGKKEEQTTAAVTANGGTVILSEAGASSEDPAAGALEDFTASEGSD